VVNRRELLAMTGAVAVTGGGSGATAEVVVAGEASDGALASPAELSGRALPRRIAFGSCARQDKPQPIWDAVLASEPDLFVFLGDNIYGDTRDPTVLRAKYAQLAAQPGFKRLRERVPVLARRFATTPAGRHLSRRRVRRGGPASADPAAGSALQSHAHPDT